MWTTAPSKPLAVISYDEPFARRTGRKSAPSTRMSEARSASRFGADAPFHAREVHAPSIACFGRPAIGRRLAQHLPRHRDLDGPAFIPIARSIDRAEDIDADLQARDIPRVDGRAAIAIRLEQHQIP